MKNTKLSFKPTSRKISQYELNSIINYMLDLQKEFNDLKIMEIRNNYLESEKADFLHVEFNYKNVSYSLNYTFMDYTNTKHLYIYEGSKNIYKKENIKDFLEFTYTKYEITDLLKAI